MTAAVLKLLVGLFGQPRPTTPVTSEPTNAASYRLHIPRSGIIEKFSQSVAPSRAKSDGS